MARIAIQRQHRLMDFVLYIGRIDGRLPGSFDSGRQISSLLWVQCEQGDFGIWFLRQTTAGGLHRSKLRSLAGPAEFLISISMLMAGRAAQRGKGESAFFDELSRRTGDRFYFGRCKLFG